MFPTLSSIFVAALYALSALLIFKQLGLASRQQAALMPALLATLIQVPLLYYLIALPQGLNLSFFVSLALISWLTSLQILLAACFKRVESLGVVIFPMSGLAGLCAHLSTPFITVKISDNAIQGHIMVSVVAYSLITLGASQAVLLAYQNHALRSHPPNALIAFLPSLQDMESLLFLFLSCGFIFLSISLLSGFFFLEDIFAQHLAHKTVLSITAWLALGTLLFGHLQFGWRGKTAIRWTLSAFALLILAFFGSKLVLEFILR